VIDKLPEKLGGIRRLVLLWGKQSGSLWRK
jgi:hypothetical protein